MKFYTKKEIEIKKEESLSRIPTFYKYKIINGFLCEYNEKEIAIPKIINIDEILINNNLKPNERNLRFPRDYFSEYNTTILHNSVLKINQKLYRSKKKKGLIDDWLIVSDISHYFDTNLKLIELNETCQIWLENDYPLNPKHLTHSLKNYIFDTNYRTIFKYFIINENEFFFELNSGKFIEFLGAIITPIDKSTAIYTLLNKYDFMCNIKDSNHIDFELIKSPLN